MQHDPRWGARGATLLPTRLLNSAFSINRTSTVLLLAGYRIPP